MSERKEKSAVGAGTPATETDNKSTDIISDSNEKIKYENIDVILDKLTELVQLTRAGSNIVSIDTDSEYAVISYKNGHKRRVNIDGDSGICAVYDIIIKLV